MSTTTHRRYLAATLDTAAVREETLEGDPHLVVPILSLRGDMVIEARGATDPELVPKSTIEASIPEWNGRPVVPDHPILSANDPATTDTMVFGKLFSTSFDGDLRHEAWLNIRRAGELGGLPQQVIDNARDGVPTEVSVGVTVALDNVSGVINGERYAGVWRSITPDHLAIMPHAIGACSIEDGCGMRTAKDKQHESPLRPLIRQLQLSQEAAQSQLWEALFETAPGMLWLEQTFDDHVIYVTETANFDLRFWDQNYIVSDDTVQLVGDPTPVKPSSTETTFVALSSDNPPQETPKMCTPAERAATIQGLVDSDDNTLTAADMPSLEALSPDMLTKLMPAESDEPPEVVAPDVPAAEPIAAVLVAEESATPTAPMVQVSQQDWDKVMAVVGAHEATQAAVVTDSVAQLRAAGSTLTDDQIRGLQPEVLRALCADAATAQGQTTPQTRTVTYAGHEGRLATGDTLPPAPNSYDLALAKVVN